MESSRTISPSRIDGLNVVKAEAAGCDVEVVDEELEMKMTKKSMKHFMKMKVLVQSSLNSLARLLQRIGEIISDYMCLTEVGALFAFKHGGEHHHI